MNNDYYNGTGPEGSFFSYQKALRCPVVPKSLPYQEVQLSPYDTAKSFR